MLQIRKAIETDVELVANLSRQTFYDTFHEQNTASDMAKYIDENFNDKTIALEIADPEVTILIVEDEQEPIGYAKLSIKNTPYIIVTDKCVEICRLYCKKDVIGKGIGKYLMDESIKFAIEINMKCVWLGVWEHNIRAINFYHKFGFTKFNEHVFMLGTDRQIDWLMRKNLDKYYEENTH